MATPASPSLTRDQWQRVKALLDDVLAQPPAAREQFLEAATDDPVIRAEVRSLLDIEAEIGQTEALGSPFLDETMPSAGRQAVASMVGHTVGAYRLVQEIGHGGMGTVYLAERADGQFEKQVALKLVRFGPASPALMDRFLLERQVLARLEHPNIARLYDGGLSDTGIPYLVMEYVEGQPIDAYCASHDLNTEARLRIFLQVCDAVQFAHQNLIVHRDLKPSNVLVTADGRAKLLDFGIARLLDEDPASPGAQSMMTQMGMQMLTPAYASPEQVRGEVVTTATDVYALGVVLYELLTGQRPYDVQGLTASEVQRVICDTEPARPSTVAVRPGTSSPRPQGEARRLQQRLEGDLDTIILKALSKDPARRYASAEAMAEDLERHLSGLPVLARPDTLGYRTSKFVRRNKLAALASMAVAVALVLAAVVSIWQAQTARMERDRAQAEAQKAEAVNTFLQTVLAASDPYNEGQDVTVAQALEIASERAANELADQPEIEAAVRRTIGLTYIELSRYGDAQPHLEQALTLRQQLFGTQHPDVALSHKDLGLLHLWLGNYTLADSLFRVAVAQYRRMPDAEPALAIALNDLGSLLLDTERYDESESVLWEAYALFNKYPITQPREYATVLNNLAYAADERDDLEAADSLYRQALAITRASGDSLNVAHVLNNLGFVVRKRGEMDEVVNLWTASLELRRTALGDEHPSVALMLHNLASHHRLEGEIEAAEPLAREALAVWEATTPPDHFFRLRGRYSLARVLIAQEAYAEAEVYLRRALADVSDDVPETHSERLGSVGLLGYATMAQGRYATAEPLLRRFRDGLTATEAAEADRERAETWLVMAQRRAFEPTLN